MLWWCVCGVFLSFCLSVQSFCLLGFFFLSFQSIFGRTLFDVRGQNFSPVAPFGGDGLQTFTLLVCCLLVGQAGLIGRPTFSLSEAFEKAFRLATIFLLD